MMYGVDVDLVVTGEADLPDHVDQVTESLIALEEINPTLLDSTISFALTAPAHGHAKVEMTVKADTIDGAFNLALTCLRTAIHTVGGGTPDWETVPAGTGVTLYELAEDGANIRPLAAV